MVVEHTHFEGMSLDRDGEIIFPREQVLAVAPRADGAEIRRAPADLFRKLRGMQLPAARENQGHGGNDLLLQFRIIARLGDVDAVS